MSRSKMVILVVSPIALLGLCVLSALCVQLLGRYYWITAAKIGMTEGEVVAKIGAPAVSGIDKWQFFPWPATVRIHAIAGETKQYSRVDSYYFGLIEYWVFFDENNRVSAVAEISE